MRHFVDVVKSAPLPVHIIREVFRQIRLYYFLLLRPCNISVENPIADLFKVVLEFKDCGETEKLIRAPVRVLWIARCEDFRQAH